MKGKLLLMVLALSANEVDAIELLKPALRDANERCTKAQAVSDGRKTVGRSFRQLEAGCIMGCILLPKLEVRVRMRATVSD